MTRQVKFPEPSRMEEVPAYSVLSRYYNDVMDHIDYPYWALYLSRVAEDHGKEYNRGIDFACGTGSLARELMELGYDMVGVDGCAEMIEKAKLIKPIPGRKIKFDVCDLRELPLVPKQQLGICVYDSLNYLMYDEDVLDFFAIARETLENDGLLVVDLSTQQNSKDHFNGYVVEEEVQGAVYRRQTQYDPDERIQHNIFEIYPDNEDVMYYEHHQQRIWSISHILELMKKEGFRNTNIYHEMTLRPGGEKSNRVHIAAEPV